MLRRLASVALATALWTGIAIIPAAAPAIPLPGGIGPATVLAADDIELTSAARYVVLPKRGVVRVTVDIRAVNVKPNRVIGGVITRYFYDGINLGVQPEATRIRATQDGRAISVTSAKRDGFRLVTAKFRDDLYHQQSARIRLMYDLPGGRPRSESDVRVGTAFATFLAWAFGDRGTVRIEVPSGFEVHVANEDLETTTESNGTTVLTASTSAPLDWYAWVHARNDDALSRERLQLDGGEIVVRGWPEDERWRGRVAAILTESVPDLAHRIGLPWPVDGALNVTEVHTPLLEGYAGFYDLDRDEITISEHLDNQTIVHEASHAWFNRALFEERWITEGLAEEYAARVLTGLGREASRPGSVKRTAKVAFPLNDWPAPAPIRDEQTNRREQYGYDAAWSVIRAVMAGAGEDGMRRVFAAAADRTTAYPGEGDPEPARLPNDWRRFLDLTEELGGAVDVDDLLATWALPADAVSGLEDRQAARDAYAAFTAADGDWAPPPAVRMALDAWAFDDAQVAIDEAEAVLARHAELAGLATAHGLQPPDDVQERYELAASADDLRSAGALATDMQASLQAVAAADAAAEAPRDWLVTLGLTGKDPDADLAAARAAWQAGRLAEAAEAATLVSGTLAVAAEAGRGRAVVIGGGVAIVLLLVVLLLVVSFRLRSRRRLEAAALRAAGAAEAGTAASVAEGPPGVDGGSA